jgi:hypothetical protein
MKWRPFQSGVPYTCQDCPAYAELQAELNKWRSIANQLVSGAERQIDDLREMISESNGSKVATIPSNVHWIAAWRRHDEAVRGE